MVWPSIKDKWGDYNDRWVSVTFNEEIVNKIIDDLDMDLICKTHQVVEKVWIFC